MQVFKLFFKILKSQLGLMIMYIVIFLGITQIITSMNSTDAISGFTESNLDITVSDLSNSNAGKAFEKYILTNNTSVDIPDYTDETIQDELYNRNTSNVIVIPKDFEERILAGDTDNLLKIYNIPGTMASNIITNKSNTYITTLSSYIAGGYSLEDATLAAEKALDTKTEVMVLSKKTTPESNPLSMYLTYIAYVFIAIAVTGISPIVQIFNKFEYRKRFSCSPYRLSKSSLELIAGTAIVGAAICLIFTLFSLAKFGDELLTVAGALSVVNMAVYMLISLSIAYLVGVLSSKKEVVSMIANVVSLGCSFLGGVFVPLSLLGDNIVKVAHFLPSYWYISAKDAIFAIENGGSATKAWGSMGVEVLFAVLFFLIGMITQRYKKTAD